MMQSLTDYEKTLVQDAGIMLAKNRIIDKVVEMFGDVHELYKNHQSCLPADVLPVNGKIAKGEKYEGLPYVVLDYPRQFSQQHIFAIRSFFCWGNDCSITLHLKGDFVQRFAPAIQLSIADNKLAGWYIQLEGDEWQHAVRMPYQLIEKEHNYLLNTRPFIKIAKKIPLAQWDNLNVKFEEYFKTLIAII